MAEREEAARGKSPKRAKKMTNEGKREQLAAKRNTGREPNAAWLRRNEGARD